MGTRALSSSTINTSSTMNLTDEVLDALKPTRPQAVEYVVQHRQEFERLLLELDANKKEIQNRLTRLVAMIDFLWETPLFKDISERNSHDFLHILRVMLKSYHMSSDFKSDLNALFHCQLGRKPTADLSHEQVSQLNLHILQAALGSQPLSEQELHFQHFIMNQELFLKRPSWIGPEQYHQKLLLSYDLKGYAAFQLYLDALQSGNRDLGEFDRLWISPAVPNDKLSSSPSARAQVAHELKAYMTNIEPLPDSFYIGAPVKTNGYNACFDAPVFGDGQFVFFRLTPDSDRHTSSNMGNRFLVFSSKYLSDFGVAYFSDLLDPLIHTGVQFQWQGKIGKRTTRQSTEKEIIAFENKNDFNPASSFYTVCYSWDNQIKCVVHNAANDIFFGPDIRLALALRLILELRRICEVAPSNSYVNTILNKTHMDDELRKFMTGVLHIQVLYPALYPMDSSRFLHVVEGSE